MDAAKTSIKAKQLAAQLIPRFFKFFPELSSQAVETQIDLIEQEELAVSVSHINYRVLFLLILIFIYFVHCLGFFFIAWFEE